MHNSGKSKRKKWRILWRLPYARVSAHDRWNHLPERHGRREVASVDDAANAKSTAVGEQLLVG